jgi:hypothetical protein
MNILIISIALNWVYKLYEEYILSFKRFINKYYDNINIYVIYFDLKIFHMSNLNKLNFFNYDKIFYTGDIENIHIIVSKMNNNYNKIYYINIEQMSHPSYYKMIRTLNTEFNIIDYSEENIPYLKNIYKNVFLFPPFFYTDNKCKTKDIDILSLTNNSYRSTILNKNTFDKFKFNILFIDDCYGQLRDEYFSKSKIYINIHCSDDHNTMEMIRLVNLIFKKVIVISQKSINTDLLFLKNYIIICNDLDNLVEYTCEILHNYDFYYNKIYGNFDEDSYYLYIKHNIDQIIQHGTCV